MSNITLLSSNATNAEASQIVGTVNGLITSINSGTAGIIAANTATVGTTAVTTEEILQTFTLPANYLSATRRILRIKSWGVTGATANNKTVKLYFGASTFTVLSAAAANNVVWSMEAYLLWTAAATNKFLASGQQGITPVQPTFTAGTDDSTTALVIKTTGQNGTAAANDILCYGQIVEVLQ